MKFGLFYEHQLPQPWGEESELRLYQQALDQIEGGDALGDTCGMIVVWRHQGNAVAEADPFGPLRAGGEKYLRCGRVRVLFEKMVLDFPDVVDAEPVGKLDLIERLLVKPQLAFFAPGLRQLVLVKRSEFNPPVSFPPSRSRGEGRVRASSGTAAG